MKDIHYILFAEIIQRYSIIEAKNKQFYFKHPILKEYFQESLNRQELIREADIIGLKSKEELINIAYDSGKWTKEKDLLIEDLEFSVKSKNKFINKVEDNNMRKEILSQIDRDTKELNDLLNEKNVFTRASKENFVEQKMIKKSFSKRLFYDVEFTEPISVEDLNICYEKYLEKYLDLNNRDNLLWIAFLPDLIDLFVMYEDTSIIFDEKGLNLTTFQKNLLSFGHSLINKLKNSYKMPDAIKNNPIKIYEWTENSPSKSNDDSDFKIRDTVKRAGGLENMKPEDKIT